MGEYGLIIARILNIHPKGYKLVIYDTPFAICVAIRVWDRE